MKIWFRQQRHFFAFGISLVLALSTEIWRKTRTSEAFSLRPPFFPTVLKSPFECVSVNRNERWLRFLILRCDPLSCVLDGPVVLLLCRRVAGAKTRAEGHQGGQTEPFELPFFRLLCPTPREVLSRLGYLKSKFPGTLLSEPCLI